MKIFNAKPEVFVDEDLSRPIKVFTSIEGSKKFIGTAVIPIPHMGNIDCPFEIEAECIADAYLAYDEACKAEIERIEKEVEEQSKANSIVVPKKDIVI